MTQRGERRLRDGETVAVHRNSGLRKICDCPRRAWAKCPHPWHFNFCWRGTPYRFSLSRYAGKEITGKTEAETLGEEIRNQIRAGTFERPSLGEPPKQESDNRDVSFETFARLFLERYSKERGKASWRDDGYMIKQLVS